MRQHIAVMAICALASGACGTTSEDIDFLYEENNELEVENRALQERLDALEAELLAARPAIELALRLTELMRVDEAGDVVFEATNVHIRNGSGESYPDEPNGKGNLVLGYNEGTPPERTGSHNLIIGPGHRYTGSGSIVAGQTGSSYGNGSSVLGGFENTATEFGSVVVGGAFNTAQGRGAVVVGGEGNGATGRTAAVGGGLNNVASGEASTIGGGYGITNSTGSTFKPEP